MIPVPRTGRRWPAGLYEFYKDPESQSAARRPPASWSSTPRAWPRHFPNDDERPPIPQWIEKSITHDERISSKRAQVYPLLVMSNHGRWRVHAQCDDIPWTREAPTCKVKGFDGYMYEPLLDATRRMPQPRGIKHGDIVKVFNERGGVLCGALCGNGSWPGVISIDHGARADFIIPGKLDRGGAINTITPEGTDLQALPPARRPAGSWPRWRRSAWPMMDEWKTTYPEAFEREYDPASGLRFNAWVEGGK